MSEISSLEWALGDRFQSRQDKSLICTLVKIREGGKKPYTLEWNNKRKAQSAVLGSPQEERESVHGDTPRWRISQLCKRVHCDESWLLDMKFLEEKEIALKCNSNTPVSSQESEVLTLELMPPEQPTESLLNSSSKITATLKQYSITDSQISLFTAISRTTTQNLENLTSTQLDFLAQGHRSQVMVQDLTTQNQNSGLKPCGALPTVAPTSSSLKILQDLSTKDYEQFLEDSEWLATSGMIRKSYQLRNLDRPSEEKGFSSLPTPTTYAKGSTGCRPAGATRLEQKLRPYIIKGDKLNPAVPGWMMGFPVGWTEWPLMDTGETISVQLPFIPEFATTSTKGEIATTSTPDQSAPSKQRSQSSESVTSPTLLQQLKPSCLELNLYICNSFLNIGKVTEVWQTCFTVDWNNEIKCYFWERDEQVISELAIAPQHLIDKFLEEKLRCQVVPENFLEETQPQPYSVQKPKGRQRKGCLYRYIENKKLKSGAIASYPRVIGHRNPDNPTHWRWGFNWEEKIDGEWKGRSIGSVPLGAMAPTPAAGIALIQSMQNEGVSLEEIIGFIRRAKAKK